MVAQVAASQLTPEAAAGVSADLNAYRDMYPARSDVVVRACSFARDAHLYDTTNSTFWFVSVCPLPFVMNL